MIVAGIAAGATPEPPTSKPQSRRRSPAPASRAGALQAIATARAKAAEPGIAATAAKLGLSVVPIADAELKAAGTRVTTRSDRVLALTGVPSLAEAAALAAAGPSSRLIASRLVVGAATCALASSGGAQ